MTVIKVIVNNFFKACMYMFVFDLIKIVYVYFLIFLKIINKIIVIKLQKSKRNTLFIENMYNDIKFPPNT